jgi:ferrous-iron efflux pump FieF
VGFIVIWVSFRLGLQAVNALMDSAPEGMEKEIIRIVEKIPGVIDCHHVRIRVSGPQFFIDLHVRMRGSQTLERAHALTEEIETALQGPFPNADITVHAEPEK